MANGINSAGTVVGTDGNKNAFSLDRNAGSHIYSQWVALPPSPSGSTTRGTVVGQYSTAAGTSPGFIQTGSTVDNDQRSLRA